LHVRFYLFKLQPTRLRVTSSRLPSSHKTFMYTAGWLELKRRWWRPIQVSYVVWCLVFYIIIAYSLKEILVKDTILTLQYTRGFIKLTLVLARILVLIYTHTHTHTYTHIHTYILTYLQAYMLHTYTYIHIYIHTYIHIYTRTYTVRSESCCALTLRSVDLVVSIEFAVEVCCCFTVFSC
jgi:hypothetical protein